MLDFSEDVNCCLLQACRMDPIYWYEFGPAELVPIYGLPINLRYIYKRVPALLPTDWHASCLFACLKIYWSKLKVWSTLHPDQVQSSKSIRDLWVVGILSVESSCWWEKLALFTLKAFNLQRMVQEKNRCWCVRNWKDFLQIWYVRDFREQCGWLSTS